MFRLLVQSVRDYAIFMLDPEGNVVTWNEGAERLKGYTESEIVGKHFSIFFPDAVKLSGWPEHELAMASREGRFEDEGWRVRKDGSQFWADVVITAVRDESGTHVGFTKVTRDLTERKITDEALRLSEERYRMLVEAVSDYAIFMLDAGGHVITWNRGAERLKGYAFEEIVGEHFSIFYPPEAIALQWPQHELEIARKEGRFEDTGWRVRKDGSRFWANVIITAVFDAKGCLLGFSKVTRDITERRRFEESNRQLTEQLQQRVSELAAANRALLEKSHEIETFVYSVSHDVRGPLVSLQGFNEEIQRSCDDLLQALENDPVVPDHVLKRVRRIIATDIDESTGYMQKAVTHLANIIDSLLRLSRIGRVEYRHEPVDMAATIRRVLSSAQRTIEQEGVHAVVGDLPPAVGDPGALEQVFANLITNAIRYRDRSRECRIEIGGRKSVDAKNLIYYVKDNGLGIPADALPEMFTAFRRFHPQASPGEGMGLLTVKRILERHNGKIRVDSMVGEGSTFTIELPAAAEA